MFALPHTIKRDKGVRGKAEEPGCLQGKKILKDLSCLSFPFQYRMRSMKRISTLIVLIGLVMGAVLTGCDSGSKTETKTETKTDSTTTTTTNATAPK
jgi:hypothetical protein